MKTKEINFAHEKRNAIYNALIKSPDNILYGMVRDFFMSCNQDFLFSKTEIDEIFTQEKYTPSKLLSMFANCDYNKNKYFILNCITETILGAENIATLINKVSDFSELTDFVLRHLEIISNNDTLMEEIFNSFTNMVEEFGEYSREDVEDYVYLEDTIYKDWKEVYNDIDNF